MQFKDDNWDLLLMRLERDGQEVDLGGTFEARVFDQATKKWTLVYADFSTAETKEIFGRRVPVVARQFLINYKTKLGREVDLLDVANLRAANN